MSIPVEPTRPAPAEVAGWLERVAFDARGLVPVVAQHASTEEVLMVAWANREALELTVQTGQAHFWSRRRGEIWRKGETSGNVLHVHEVWLDCDGDVVVYRVTPSGPVCHTGARTCFAEGPALRLDAGPGLPAALPYRPELWDTILQRRRERPEGSYVVRLLDAGTARIARKVGEEAVEVLVAALADDPEALVAELADLWFHSLVLLADRGLAPGDVAAELARRHGRRRAAE